MCSHPSFKKRSVLCRNQNAVGRIQTEGALSLQLHRRMQAAQTREGAFFEQGGICCDVEEKGRMVFDVLLGVSWLCRIFCAPDRGGSNAWGMGALAEHARACGVAPVCRRSVSTAGWQDSSLNRPVALWH